MKKMLRKLFGFIKLVIVLFISGFILFGIAVWGYDIPYLLTGILNAHPSSAIQFIKDKRSDYAMFYQDLLDDVL